MTCGGQCCAVFTYTKTPEELRLDWETGRNHGWDADSLLLADMFVPLTFEEAVERKEFFGINGAVYAEHQHYTCRHWDEETRRCGIYDHRPGMCAGYPYENGCTHCGNCSEVGVTKFASPWVTPSVN